MVRRRPGHDAHDIALDVVERFLRTAAEIMAAYPDPARYAAVSATHATITFDRRERKQRSEGVRLVTGSDGLLRAGRVYVSGNVTPMEGGDELLALARDGDDAIDVQVACRHDSTDLLERCFAGVSRADRELLLLVDGKGYTVQEVARLVGVRRETLSRRIGRTRRQVQSNRAALACPRQDVVA